MSAHFSALMEFDRDFEQAGVRVEHVFLPKHYTKVTHIPAGVTLMQHAHAYSHRSILVSGAVMVEVEGVGELMTGPSGREIEAGKQHSVTALEPAIWLCQHDTDETDSAQVDAAIVEGR